MIRPDCTCRVFRVLLSVVFLAASSSTVAGEADVANDEITVPEEAAPVTTTPLPSGTDTIYMTETVISGNQELPRVLYIVPWRETGVTEVPDSSTLLMPQLDNIQPLNPREFRRQLDIHESVVASAEEEKK
ncbi:MAG: hypothetical protein AAF525_01425 [Pseudomonadota bacterium]